MSCDKAVPDVTVKSDRRKELLFILIIYNESAWGVRIYTSREPNKIFQDFEVYLV